MPKRLHDTEIWSKQWFRSLSLESKLLWMYLKDKCTCSGIVEIDDLEQIAFFIGKKVSDKNFNDLDKQILKVDSKRILIIDFIEFQYGHISPDHKMYKKVMSELAKFNIKYPIYRVSTVSDTVMDMDKDKDKDTKKEGCGEETPIENEDPLDPEWSSYLKMRLIIKKPATEAAKNIARSTLEKLAPGDLEKQKSILNQSTFNSWQGLFPLRSDHEKNKQPEPKVSYHNYL